MSDDLKVKKKQLNIQYTQKRLINKFKLLNLSLDD